MNRFARWTELPAWAPIAVCLVAANALLLVPAGSPGRAVGAVGLLLLPGVGWAVGLVPALGRTRVEALLLGAGLGLSVATALGLALHLAGLPLRAGPLVVLLDLVAVAGLLFAGRNKVRLSLHLPGWQQALALLSIVLLAGALRLVNLGYSEYQGDEIRALQPARAVAAGEPGVLVAQKKGPAQSLIAAEMGALTDGFRESDMRLPFALSSLAAILCLFRLGAAWSGAGVGWIAALLLAIDGIVLAFSRVVQYQAVVLFMSALAVLCAWKAQAEIDKRTAARYLVLSGVFCAVGLLAHYDAAFALPAVAYLWLRSLRNGMWRAVGLGSFLAAVLLLSFYVPFLANPRFSQTFSGYTEGKLEPGLYNNIDRFVQVASFYNSIWYLAVVFAGVVLAAWLLGRQANRGWLGRLPAVVLGLGLLLAVGFPVLFQVGTVEWAIVIAAPFAAMLAARRVPASLRTVGLWFLAPFVSYMFLLRAPGLHYYALMPSCALLAAVGVQGLARSLQRRATPFRLAAGLLGCALFALAAYYPALLFLRVDLRYALTFPQRTSRLYPTWHSTRPDMVFFGFPHKVGWKAIDHLYASGTLRGSFVTNEKLVIDGWYFPELAAEGRLPRYVFYSTDSAGYKDLENFRLDRIESYYRPAGAVTVDGVPRLSIYQLDPPSGPPVVYAAEEYERAFDEALRPTSPRAPSDADLVPLAQFLESVAAPGDALIVADPADAGPLFRHYRGALPLAGTDGGPGAAWAAARSPAPADAAEVWPFGAYTLSLLSTSRSPDTPRAIAPSTLAGAVVPVAYRLPERTVCPGRDLRLSLFWWAQSRPAADYTVFVHLVDGAGVVWAQDDRRPGGGARPTSGWLAGDVVAEEYVLSLPSTVPAGSYRLEFGMYRAESGVRATIEGAGGPSDRVVLPGEVAVEAQCKGR